MINKHVKQIIIIVLVIIAGLSITTYGYCDEAQKKHILILNSYNMGYQWTDNMVRGIEDTFSEVDTNFIIRNEYMDCKNVNHEAYLKAIYDLFKYKYNNYHFDIIIANDEYAYNFLMKYGEDLFGDIPVVICGFNDKESFTSSHNKPLIIVEERIDITGTINLALNIHEETENIYIILDHSLIGNFLKQEILEIIPKNYKQIDFHFIQESELQNVIKEVENISQDSIILQTGVFKDKEGDLITVESGNKIVSEKSGAPVYVLWDAFVTDGVVGGKVSNSYNLGRITGEKAIELLEGVELDNIQLRQAEYSQGMFNFNEIRSKGISTTELPKNSIFINRPNTYVNISKQKIYSFLVVVIVILAWTNTILVLNYLKRKKTEKQLVREKDTLKAVLDSTRDAIIVVDNRDDSILHANRQFKSMWKIPDELAGETCDHILIENVKDQLVDPVDFVKTTKEVDKYTKSFSDILNFKDGRVFERSYKPLLVNGEVKGKVWCCRDVTKRVESENELKRSEELYKKLVELLPDAVIVRKEREVIVANEAAFKLINAKKPDSLESDSINEMFKVTDDYLDIVNERLEELLHKETTVDFIEQKGVLKNGDIIDMEAGSSSFKHGEDWYIISVIRDIRERKKAEDLQKKIIEKNLLLKEVREYDRLKTEFFATISHELKTPLNIILGGLQLMHSSHKDSKDCQQYVKFLKYIDMMKQNCYRLLRLINNLIDITRIDSGYMDIRLENHNVIKVIEDITQSVSQYIKDNGINLVFDTNVEEKLIACDAEKMERVMLNLLSNAVKFTDTGGQIEVNIIAKESVVIISVKDTGIGIPDEMKLEIFERFRQVDSSLRRKREGSGIGLSLVKSIIELHGGEIQVKSEAGKGSEFILTLPVNSCEEEESIKQEIAATTPVNVERIQVEFSDIYS